MATNQVLHGSNRVVEHPNRYKLNAVAGQSNVYDLEKQAGVITDNGTPYNKNILDKIDNVLSYLTPSVEKVQGQLKEYSGIEAITPINILNTEKSVASTSDTSILNYNVDIPEAYMKFNVKTKMSSGYQDYITIQLTLENGTVVSEVAVVNSTGSYILSTITFSSIPSKVTNINVLLSGNTSSRVVYCNLVEIVGIGLPIYSFQNAFTLDNNTTFTNNQRVLVETPSTLDLTSVETNSLNGVDIPTLLKPSTMYELKYNESLNKFELDGLMNKPAPIFDITLTESVHEVDLNGLEEMLEIGKLYELVIIGYSDYAGYLKFGSSPSIYIYGVSSNDIQSSICLFVPYTKGDNILYIACITRGQAGVDYTPDSIITNNEKLIHLNNGKVIKAGTRIIIKEVA